VLQKIDLYYSREVIVPELVRFSISLEKGLLGKFDQLVEERGLSNRSEAVRDLIRQEFVKKEWDEGKQVAGAVTLIYDHHQRDLVNKLMNMQHDYSEVILSSQHVHLDHHHCLEIVAVKGKASKVRMLAEQLKGAKGVMHGTLSMTTTGGEIG
jgi:CopG family nickel-responsive transcriptional regulator